MARIGETARFTGRVNGTVSDLAQLAVNVDRQISGNGTAWPQTSGQGLIDNCWLVWSNMTSRLQTSTDVEPMTLGQAIARFGTRIPVELREGDTELPGHVIRVSMRAAVNDIWPDLPLGKYSADADERDRVAYAIRKKLGQFLRDSMNAVCVHRPRQRRGMATWWVSAEWQDAPPRRRGTAPTEETEPSVVDEDAPAEETGATEAADATVADETVVTDTAPTPSGQRHLCPYPECADRVFYSARALAIHDGHIHKDKTEPSVVPAQSPVATRAPAVTALMNDLAGLVDQLVLDNQRLQADLASARQELVAARQAKVLAESKTAALRKLVQIARQLDDEIN